MQLLKLWVGNVKQVTDLAAIRREYGALSLDEAILLPCPIKQCKEWLETAIKTEIDDPTAMVLATVDKTGFPDTRVVLLKEIKENGFVFYTNYNSSKGEQIEHQANVALNFYWPKLARQIRIRGYAEKLDAHEADLYFATRPYLSQLSACVSLQSQAIPDISALSDKIETLKETYPKGQVPRPANWGGYIVIPKQIEFWQGKDSRLHDRFVYISANNAWIIKRLAP